MRTEEARQGMQRREPGAPARVFDPSAGGKERSGSLVPPGSPSACPQAAQAGEADPRPAGMSHRPTALGRREPRLVRSPPESDSPVTDGDAVHRRTGSRLPGPTPDRPLSHNLQPLDLHVEAADLLVEFGLERLALVVLAATAVAEERLGA